MSNLRIKISVSKICLRKKKSLMYLIQKMSFISKNCIKCLLKYLACLF